MMNEELNKVLSNPGIIILQQIEDCRDRNDTVLQFTIDPLTFSALSSNSNASSSSNAGNSMNDLKLLLDDELLKNFSLTSSTNELIFSAVNCSLLFCMRVLASMRKKSWVILTSNAYLDIYTNCIVKTFYFEKSSGNQPKLLSVTTPTAVNNQIPAFAPRSNLMKRTSTFSKNESDAGNTPSSSILENESEKVPVPVPTASALRSTKSFTTSRPSQSFDSADPIAAVKGPTNQPQVRRETIRRPPPVASSVSTSKDPLGSDPSNSSSLPNQPYSKTTTNSISTNSLLMELNDPEDQYKSLSRTNASASFSSIGSIQKQGSVETKQSSNQVFNPPASSPQRANTPAKVETSRASAAVTPSPAPVNGSSTNLLNGRNVSPVPSSNSKSYGERESEDSKDGGNTINTNIPLPGHLKKALIEQDGQNQVPTNRLSAESMVEGSKNGVAEVGEPLSQSNKEEKMVFSSPLSLMSNFKAHQSLPLNLRDMEGLSPVGGANKNAEYFKKLKEVQDADKQRQLEEEAKMSAFELQKKREAEAEIQQHETSKTAHYARLGATFVNRGSPLVGTGRGAVPTGRLGGRGNR